MLAQQSQLSLYPLFQLAGFAAAQFTDASAIPALRSRVVDYLVGKGAISGTPAGDFEPQKEITRGEAATILAKTLKPDFDKTLKTNFPDAKRSLGFCSYCKHHK